MWERSMPRRTALIATVLVVSSIAWADQPMRAIVEANSVSIGACVVASAEYRYGDVPFKPYVKELFTMGGLNVLLDAPHDHLHHHGLMFAVAVDGVNFWEESPRAGRQKHVRFADIADSNEGVSQSAGFMPSGYRNMGVAPVRRSLSSPWRICGRPGT